MFQISWNYSKHDIVFHQNIKYGSFDDLDRGFLFEE